VSSRPSAGARFLLEREGVEAGGEVARYRGGIFTPDAEHRFGLILRDDGTAALEGAGACPEHEERLLDLARSIARAAPRRRAEGLVAWPDRQVRWRGPGRG
jgi:hypothetical protein